ncbi:hypothetical protein [Streptomyces sp. NPDC048172]|uniref:hypothetical protein n=1 Tax=Streptomyces sp. NPDC048172 TaxID=3365505 RepID=UPI003723ED9B
MPLVPLPPLASANAQAGTAAGRHGPWPVRGLPGYGRASTLRRVDVEPHCSKCCPVKPPKAEPPGPVPGGALAWLALIVVVFAGGYAGLLYGAALLFS